MTKLPNNYNSIIPATHCTVHNTLHMHTQGYGLCMQPHKPEPPTHTMSTSHQARWLGELTWSKDKTLMGHGLMLIIRLTRSNGLRGKSSLTCIRIQLDYVLYIYSYEDWLTLWCQYSSCKREKQSQWYNLFHDQSWEAGTLTTTRTPSTHHIKTSPSNQPSLVNCDEHIIKETTQSNRPSSDKHYMHFEPTTPTV